MINHLSYHYCLLVLLNITVEAVVRPPPWADPKINPCANRPTGWQLIYWPANGQCYKIFQEGYPCPETMELVPILNTRQPKRSIKAECRCPPAYVQYETNGRCYQLYKKGPCQNGQYFAPRKEITNQNIKTRFGICLLLKSCKNENEIFWPIDNKCYRKHTQGPCPKGQLLDKDQTSMVPECKCTKENDMEQYYWEAKRACYELYTKGPCQEKGHLFLPGRVCDCHPHLPHYHNGTKQCYQLGSRGPCKRGHQFVITTLNSASCQCKNNHVLWPEDGNCYRPFTQGPCPLAQILANASACIPMPCGKGSLYFPEQQTCYRIGSQGPCPIGQIVTFDFQVRPSIDGISHNGICGCTGPYNNNEDNNSCLKEKRSILKSCDTGMVLFKNKCHHLYTQGPCPDGQWLVPQRQNKTQSLILAECDCKSGFTATYSNDKNHLLKCLSPVIGLAHYLNQNYLKGYT